VIALAICLFELALALHPIANGTQDIDRIDAARLRLDQEEEIRLMMKRGEMPSMPSRSVCS
jgi:hypothetical protein